jgi:hypothetical protein
MAGVTAVPLLDRRQSTRALAAQVGERVPAGGGLVLLAGHHDGRLHLWTGVERYEVVPVESLGAAAERPGELWVLGREAAFGLVPAAVQARFQVELEWPGGGRNDFILLRERSPP